MPEDIDLYLELDLYLDQEEAFIEFIQEYLDQETEEEKGITHES